MQEIQQGSFERERDRERGRGREKGRGEEVKRATHKTRMPVARYHTARCLVQQDAEQKFACTVPPPNNLTTSTQDETVIKHSVCAATPFFS